MSPLDNYEKLNAREIADKVSRVRSTEQLDSIEKQETEHSGDNRKTVMDAIEARRAELGGSSPEAPDQMTQLLARAQELGIDAGESPNESDLQAKIAEREANPPVTETDPDATPPAHLDSDPTREPGKPTDTGGDESTDEGHGPEGHERDPKLGEPSSPQDQVEATEGLDEAESARDEAQATKIAALARSGADLDGSEDDALELIEKEPFFEGGLRDQADRSNNDPDAVDPTTPNLNAEYVRRRAEDTEEYEIAVRTQEGTISSNTDDFAQRESAARQAAEGLRVESILTDFDRPENAGQHVISSAKAEDGVPYTFEGHVPPPSEEYKEQLLATRDKGTDKSKRLLSSEAKRILDDLEGETAVVPYAKRSAPLETGMVDEDLVPEDYPEQGYPADHPVPFSEPQLTALTLGSAVSRLDYHHQEIGVVTEIDNSSSSYPIVKVEFPTEEAGWFPPNNLRFEGIAKELVKS
jgi:hypothetical protein